MMVPTAGAYSQIKSNSHSLCEFGSELSREAIAMACGWQIMGFTAIVIIDTDNLPAIMACDCGQAQPVTQCDSESARHLGHCWQLTDRMRHTSDFVFSSDQ
jgi:hypothetical protein